MRRPGKYDDRDPGEDDRDYSEHPPSGEDAPTEPGSRAADDSNIYIFQ
jgi:hypothetical protein